MKVGDTPYRTIWIKKEDPRVIQIIDQRHLPHEFVIEDLRSVDEMAVAISDMHLRGAGLIGVAGGYGMYLACLEGREMSSLEKYIHSCADKLKGTRPTAVNLAWAIDRQLGALKGITDHQELVETALRTADDMADEDAEFSRKIGEYGLEIIEKIRDRKKGGRINILTHCNAGWLAFIDYGTATAPIYAAHDKGLDVHVWVDETRPRNQGARLTAWELKEHGVPHTIITDNVGGHLMQHGQVDMVIVGSDRTTYTGDVANKIGTYLKALAAHDNKVPFYVALPSTTIDWQARDGVKEIPIEERGEEEVKWIQGLENGQVKKVLLTPLESPAANYAFDVTPARLVTGLITERGICEASEKGILRLFPEHR